MVSFLSSYVCIGASTHLFPLKNPDMKTNPAPLCLIFLLLSSFLCSSCTLEENEYTPVFETWRTEVVYNPNACCENYKGETLNLCVSVYGMKAKSNGEISVGFCRGIDPNYGYSMYLHGSPELLQILEKERRRCYSFLNKEHSNMMGNKEFTDCIYEFYTTWYYKL